MVMLGGVTSEGQRGARLLPSRSTTVPTVPTKHPSPLILRSMHVFIPERNHLLVHIVLSEQLRWRILENMCVLIPGRNLMLVLNVPSAAQRRAAWWVMSWHNTIKMLMRSEARCREETSATNIWSKLSNSVLTSASLSNSGVTKMHHCHYCPYTTTFRCNLLRHERTHTGEKPYSCPHCNFRCTQNCDLKKHIRIHTGEKPFACAHCPYRSSRSESLKSHMRIHAVNEGS